MGQLVRLSDAHRDLVHRFRDEAERWLAGRGLEQWNGARAKFAHDALDRLLDAGEMFGWEDGGEVRAVAAITGPDMDFWTEAEAAEPASYLGRFMVSEHGRGWGERLLEAVASREQEEGRTALRLDCWRDNVALHRFYERHGFQHVRTVEVPGRQSGALFERRLSSPA